MPEDRGAQIGEEALADPHRHVPVDEGDHAADQGDRDVGADHPGKGPEVTRGQHIVDEDLEHPDRQRVQGRRDARRRRASRRASDGRAWCRARTGRRPAGRRGRAPQRPARRRTAHQDRSRAPGRHVRLDGRPVDPGQPPATSPSRPTAQHHDRSRRQHRVPQWARVFWVVVAVRAGRGARRRPEASGPPPAPRLSSGSRPCFRSSCSSCSWSSWSSCELLRLLLIRRRRRSQARSGTCPSSHSRSSWPLTLSRGRWCCPVV